MMYAIVELAGKQFSVEKGSRIRCEKLDRKPNDTFAIDRVLMVKSGDQTKIGTPYLQGVEVRARVTGHGRGKKIIGLKYKNKINYRKHYGHRQDFTAVVIEEIKG